MLSRTRLLWLSTTWDCQDIHRDNFWFFLKDEVFVSKIMNYSINLDKFLASKVRQLAKKMESSKVTARYIKQVASDPQLAQINLMWHQHTYLPASKHKKKKSFVKPRPPSHNNDASYRQQVSSYHNNNCKKSFDAKNFTRTRRDARSVENQYILRVSSVQQRNISASLATSMDTLQDYVIKRNKLH